jgi:hypothetical protein
MPGASHLSVDTVYNQLDRIEDMVGRLLKRETKKDWYTVAELAALVGKAEFTVREWCRCGRLQAEKRGSGRGLSKDWVVSHVEVDRYQREGLLPIRQPGQVA